jgi:hypothetical protein
VNTEGVGHYSLSPIGKCEDLGVMGVTGVTRLFVNEPVPMAMPAATRGRSMDKTDEQVIADLCQLDALGYERSRRKAAKALGCRLSVLDRMVELARHEQQWSAWTRGRESVVPQQPGDPDRP